LNTYFLAHRLFPILLPYIFFYVFYFLFIIYFAPEFSYFFYNDLADVVMFSRENSLVFDHASREFLDEFAVSPGQTIAEKARPSCPSGLDDAVAWGNNPHTWNASAFRDDGLEADATSTRALDFVTRPSNSVTSMDDHFAKISGSRFEESKKTVVDVYGAGLGRRRRIMSGDRGANQIEDSMEDWGAKLEYEQSDLELAGRGLDVNTTAQTVGPKTHVAVKGVVIGGNEAIIDGACDDTHAPKPAPEKERASPASCLSVDDEREIPSLRQSRPVNRLSHLRPNPENSRLFLNDAKREFGKKTALSRPRRWQSEGDKFAATANGAIGEAERRRMKLKDLRRSIGEKSEVKAGAEARGCVGTESADDENDDEAGGPVEKRRRDDGGSRTLLRRWGKIRSKSEPDRLPDNFFKFTRRNVNISNQYGNLESEDDLFNGYILARRNSNHNKTAVGRQTATNNAPSNRTSKNRESRDRSSTNRNARNKTSTNKDLANRASARRGNRTIQQPANREDKNSVSENRSHGDRIRTSGAKKEIWGYPKKPTSRPPQVAFKTQDEVQPIKEEEEEPQLPKPIKNPYPHKYDVREDDVGHDWDAFKNWNLHCSFDYELKPTMCTRERQRDHVPFKQKTNHDHDDEPYCVRTPPWGNDKSNPNWEWEMARSAKERFVEEEREEDRNRAKSRHPDIYLLREDLADKRRLNHGRHNDSIQVSVNVAGSDVDNATASSATEVIEPERKCFHDCRRPSTPHNFDFRQRQPRSQVRTTRSAKTVGGDGGSGGGGGIILDPKPQRDKQGKIVGFTCGCPAPRSAAASSSSSSSSSSGDSSASSGRRRDSSASSRESRKSQRSAKSNKSVKTSKSAKTGKSAKTVSVESGKAKRENCDDEIVAKRMKPSWKSVTKLGSIISMLENGRVSLEDSTSTTYLRVRPKPSTSKCHGICAQRHVVENLYCDGCSRNGVCGGRGARDNYVRLSARDTRDLREEVGPADAARLRDYEYLPTIKAESTPPWYRNSVSRRPPAKWRRKLDDYWEIDAEQVPRTRWRK